MESSVYDGDANESRPVHCSKKGQSTPTEGRVNLTVTGSHRDPNARMRRIVRASQILLAGYERLQSQATNGGMA